MVAPTMRPVDTGAAAPGRATTSGFVARFDRIERAVHWTNATLFLFLLATGLTLYGFPGTGWIGQRRVVKDLHVYIGLLMPLPILLGIATRFGRQLREDLRRISQWTADDRNWFRRARRKTARLGKFNPGQKLNAAFIGASIIVMPGTGAIMRWGTHSTSLSLRQGATFAHDWFAFGLLAAIVGHIVLAVSDRAGLRGMVRGNVTREWAEHERPRWFAEVEAIARTDADAFLGTAPSEIGSTAPVVRS